MSDIEKLEGSKQYQTHDSTNPVPEGGEKEFTGEYDDVFGQYKEGDVHYRSAGW